MISLSNFSQSTRPTGQKFWEELLILSGIQTDLFSAGASWAPKRK